MQTLFKILAVAAVFFAANVTAQGLPVPQVQLQSPPEATPDTPLFKWKGVTLASHYYVWVNNAAGVAVIQEMVGVGNAGCAGYQMTDQCSWQSNVTLPPGNYKWWINPRANGTNGYWIGWSAAKEFWVQ